MDEIDELVTSSAKPTKIHEIEDSVLSESKHSSPPVLIPLRRVSPCKPSTSPALATSTPTKDECVDSSPASLNKVTTPKRKNVLKERFILKNTEKKADPVEAAEAKDDLKNTATSVEPALSEEEINNLRLCRNKAHSKVLQKKRMHLNASLTGLILKDWKALYPQSKYSGKDLLELYESLCKPDQKKAAAVARKRRLSSARELETTVAAPTPLTPSPGADDDNKPAAVGVAVSLDDHAHRQWSSVMLSNLHYAAAAAKQRRTDLETEWKILYPNSVLTARNLKSRFTVYERTHSGLSAPRHPLVESGHPADNNKPAKPAPKRPLETQKDDVSPACVSAPKKAKMDEHRLSDKTCKPAALWTTKMIDDMFPTREQAVAELNSTFNNVIKRRWHSLWLERNPQYHFITKENLYSRYLYHSKKRSGASYNNGATPTKQPSQPNAVNNPIIKKPQFHQEKTVDSLTDTASSFWTKEYRRVLDEVKIEVEGDSTILKENYWTAIQQKWALKCPSYPSSVDELRRVLEPPSRRAIHLTEVKERSSHSTEVREELESIQLVNGVDPTAVPSEPQNGVGLAKYVCKEQPIEYPYLPKSKWICPNHYIHVFYDDEDKSYECILTDQLLQMRNSLVPKFPGLDIYKPGKKPPGFARLLLHEWKRHYPETQENNKTISKKIGRYDRAPKMLSQETVSEGGRINWTPNMIEHIRSTREKAEKELGPDAPQHLFTKRWQEEWELLYPNTNIDWRQIMSRYQYHFGSERRDSFEKETDQQLAPVKVQQPARNEEEEDIKGFRQWNRSMQEDLLILRDLIYEEHPDIDPGSKEFARRLLAAFQQRHPACMESGRSLLARLKDPLPSPPPVEPVTSQSPAVRKQQRKGSSEAKLKEAGSNIQGFEDWSIAMVRDFIVCMDKTRRKYTQMKEQDPGMKLVPLLLSEWTALYPSSGETVKTFLVRIRYLKTNKETIKKRLGEHQLLPKLSQENSSTAAGVTTTAASPAAASARNSCEEQKFVWDAQTMMPNVIATRAKAIAVQSREQEQGRKISYSKIWIKEFKKIYPNCPYTVNNLSVHYWYWNSKESGGGVKKAIGGGGNKLPDFWTEERLAQLSNLGEQYSTLLANPSMSVDVRSRGVAPLLHNHWLRLYPGCRETPLQLQRLLSKLRTEDADGFDSSTQQRLPWSPRLNNDLRRLAAKLAAVNSNYVMSQLMDSWRGLHPGRRDTAEYLLDRLDDANIPLPAIDKIIKKRLKPEATGEEVNKVDAKTKEEEQKEATPAVKPEPPSTIATQSCLNARGQMRWTNQAVTDLLECHKLAVTAKNASQPFTKLATLLHKEFTSRYPSCPVGPSVLLTKCYIFRSEIKSGKLVLEDSIAKPCAGGVDNLRTWSKDMLNELGPARRRALDRKRLLTMNSQTCQLGDLWLEEFRAKFPAYKASKKQLLKKYKWWKNQQGVLGSGETNVSAGLFQEIKAILESSNLVLPTLVSDKVVEAAKAWVLNAQLKMEEKEKKAGHQSSESNQQVAAAETASQLIDEANELKDQNGAKKLSPDEAVEQKSSNENSSQEVVSHIVTPSQNASHFTYNPASDHPIPSSQDQNYRDESVRASAENILGPAPGQDLLGLPEASTTSAELGNLQSLEEQDLQALEALGILSQGLQQANQHSMDAATTNQSFALDYANVSSQLTTLPNDILCQSLSVPDPTHDQSNGPQSGLSSQDLQQQQPSNGAQSSLSSQDLQVLQSLSMLSEGQDMMDNHSSSSCFPPTSSTAVANINKHDMPTSSTFGPVHSKSQETTCSINPKVTSPPNELQEKFANLVKTEALETPGGGEEKSSGLPSVQLLAKLSTMGLPLSCLEVALAVYQEARSAYAECIERGYVVSWSNMLKLRWDKESLVPNIVVSQLEDLVALVVREVGHPQPLPYHVARPLNRAAVDVVCKKEPLMTTDETFIAGIKKEEEENELAETKMETVPSTVDCTRELINTVVRVGREYQRDLATGFKSLAKHNVNISFKEFVSILNTVGIIKKGTSAEELDLCMDLLETWDLVSGTNNNDLHLPAPCNKILVAPAQLRATDNLSMDLVGRWLRKTRHIKGGKVSSRVRKVKASPQMWNRQGLAELLRAEKRAMRRWQRMSNIQRKRNPLRILLHWELKKCVRSTPNASHVPVDPSQVLARLVSLRDSARRRTAQLEAAAVLRMNKQYKEFLDGEAEIETIAEVPEDARGPVAGGDNGEVEDADEDNEVVEIVDYNLDHHVLRYIKEKETGKKQSSKVWTSASMGVLLKARDRAKRRRSAWETWAVDRHGSLQAAFSNPRVKVPKFEELLVEEWDKMRPNQTGVSAWTLKSYISKFEAMKQELVQEQEKEKRRQEALECPVPVPDCFPGSDIPRFDLSKLGRLKRLPNQVLDLIKTRQEAKVVELAEQSKLDYLELWRREYVKVVPNFKGSGQQLQIRLYELSCVPSIRRRLKTAMHMKMSSPIKKPVNHVGSQNGGEAVVQPPVRAEDLPTLLPRVTLFPEVDDYHVESLIRRPTLEADRKIPVITFDNEIVLNRGVGCLRVPQICLPRPEPQQAAGATRLRFASKAAGLVKPVLGKTACLPPDCDGEIFECGACDALFENYNNLRSHAILHREIVVHAPATTDTITAAEVPAGVNPRRPPKWSGWRNPRKVMTIPSEIQHNNSVSTDLCRDIIDHMLKNIFY